MPAQNHKLETLFNPKSIAIVGASRDKKKIGSIVVQNIVESGYKGDVYPVNPNAHQVHKLKCYENLQSLPEIPDLVIISVPAPVVESVVHECISQGVKNIVVFSAGYKEIGVEGKKLEEKLTKLCIENDINLLGPNCLGFINNSANLNATFGKSLKTKGNLRFISQSGALATSFIDWAEQNNLGFDQFITLGNKAVITENDILDLWQNAGEQGGPIGMYLESISAGETFVKQVKQLSQKTPVFILKPGKSEAAQHAMVSHTGAIAGADDVLNAALAEAGAIRCQSIEELFNLARAFSWSKAPKTNSIAVISNAGGPAVITADAIAETGLKFATLSTKAYQILQEALPREASIVNPIDVLGDALADRYQTAIEIVLKEPEVSALIVILTPQVMTQIHKTAEFIARVAEKHQKPIFCSFIGGILVEDGIEVLNKHQIPAFRFPEQAVKTLAQMYAWQKFKETSQIIAGEESSDESVVQTIGSLVEIQEVSAFDLLAKYDIYTPEQKNVTSLEDTLTFAQEVGFPVVLKINDPSILHKTELKGVATNIYIKESLTENYKIMTNRADQILIQKQVSGIELIIGFKTDVNFGKVLLFGAGGTLVELINDKNLMLFPLTQEKIASLVEKSKAYTLLKGYRRKKAVNFEALYGLIHKVGQIAMDYPEIKEFEINPAIIDADTIWAVDAKVLL